MATAESFWTSERGIAPRAVSEISGGHLSDLRFQCSIEQPWIEAEEKVVWRSRSRKTVGVQFVDLSGSSSRNIKNWIAQTNQDVSVEATKVADGAGLSPLAFSSNYR